MFDAPDRDQAAHELGRRRALGWRELEARAHALHDAQSLARGDEALDAQRPAVAQARKQRLGGDARLDGQLLGGEALVIVLGARFGQLGLASFRAPAGAPPGRIEREEQPLSTRACTACRIGASGSISRSAASRRGTAASGTRSSWFSRSRSAEETSRRLAWAVAPLASWAT